jgi:hypothetical protein
MSSANRLPAVAAFLTLGLYGCAGTAPKPEIVHPIVSEARIMSPDQTAVSVDADDTVNILPMEREKFAEIIESKIATRKIANASTGGTRSFAVDLHLTRFDKGNAFARAMLAGLGQIHIEGKVQVYQMPGHTLIGEFQMSKTFAWGGIYGAATSMEDIENTYADGVAATLTGQNEKKQAKN